MLGQARVLLFLSTHEGLLPLLPLEAMLSEVVVLGFRRGPMTEIIPPAGLFEFGDITRVADAAQSVLERPQDWSRVIKIGRATAISYGDREQAKSVLSAWERIDALDGDSKSPLR